MRILACILTASALALPAASQTTETQTTSSGAYVEEGIYGPDDGDWEFQLSASGANDSSFDAGAFNLGTSLGFFLTDGFELGARHNMSFFDTDDSDSNFAATTRGFLDYHLNLNRFRPFLGVSAGGLYGDEVDEAFVLAPEGGIKFYALPKTFLLGQMEYQFAFEDVDDADEAADDGQFVYTLGIGFNF